MKNICCFLISSLFLVLLAASPVIAKTVMVKNSPRPFTVISPDTWIQQETATANSRVKFVSPVETPPAQCAVIVKEYPGLRSTPQATLDRNMAKPPDADAMSAHLSAQLNNVKVISTATTSISGYIAQLYNVQYSMGTTYGEEWFRGTIVSAATTPGLTWTVSCGATGKSLKEAIKAYSYWQQEIIRFRINVKILD